MDANINIEQVIDYVSKNLAKLQPGTHVHVGDMIVVMGHGGLGSVIRKTLTENGNYLFKIRFSSTMETAIVSVTGNEMKERFKQKEWKHFSAYPIEKERGKIPR